MCVFKKADAERNVNINLSISLYLYIYIYLCNPLNSTSVLYYLLRIRVVRVFACVSANVNYSKQTR